MQIEITEKEKTACSILLGLKKKFEIESKKGFTYTATELHKTISEVIKKINKGELEYIQTLQVANQPVKERDEVWGEIDDQIERSTIHRYNWKEVFGHSLTKEILRLKKSGLNCEDALTDLLNNGRVIRFLEENAHEEENILKNLKISVHARYGENNTAKKVEEEDQ